MKCIKCNSEHTRKDGNHNGFQRYRCLDCKKIFDYGSYGEKMNKGEQRDGPFVH